MATCSVSWALWLRVYTSHGIAVRSTFHLSPMICKSYLNVFLISCMRPSAELVYVRQDTLTPAQGLLGIIIVGWHSYLFRYLERLVRSLVYLPYWNGSSRPTGFSKVKKRRREVRDFRFFSAIFWSFSDMARH